jgi:ATP-dependent DNA ligase
MAKDLDGVYTPGVRSQLKVKHAHTVDAVVCGWRAHKSPAADGSAEVGSLLLGLHDDHGGLHFVGSASSFSAAQRARFTAQLAPLAAGPDDAHPWRGDVAVRVPDEPNRWRRAGQGAATVLVRPELVAEVRADGLEGPRLRHIARFLRWRPDRAPASCTYSQFPAPAPLTVAEVLSW